MTSRGRTLVSINVKTDIVIFQTHICYKIFENCWPNVITARTWSVRYPDLLCSVHFDIVFRLRFQSMHALHRHSWHSIGYRKRAQSPAHRLYNQ